MKKLLWIIVLGLLLSTSLNAKQLSKTPFTPDNILTEFISFPKEHKVNVCFKNFDPFIDKINEDLPLKIEGYNSKMDNENKVKGTRAMNGLSLFTKE